MLPTQMYCHSLDHLFPRVSVLAQSILFPSILPHVGKRRVTQILWYSFIVLVHKQQQLSGLQVELSHNCQGGSVNCFAEVLLSQVCLHQNQLQLETGRFTPVLWKASTAVVELGLWSIFVQSINNEHSFSKANRSYNTIFFKLFTN